MKTDLTTLLERLDEEVRQSLERAAEFSINRGHFEVTVEHLLLQFLDNPQAEIHRILEHFEVDSILWIKTLLNKLESFKNDNSSPPVFSAGLLHWLEQASALNKSKRNTGEIRLSYLLEQLALTPVQSGVQYLPDLGRLKGIDIENQFDHILPQRETALSDTLEGISSELAAVSDMLIVEKTEIYEPDDMQSAIVDIDFSDEVANKPQSDIEAETIDIPGYRILKKIGKGGMADVYLACHLGLEREVAIKVLSTPAGEDVTAGERFLREARIVAKLAHPNIIQIYDVNQVGQHSYLAMEYVSDGELTEYLDSDFSITRIVDITQQILKALVAAHDNGFIHRDIKPANILFRKDGSAVLTDFGIARAMDIDSGMTIAGSMVGTPSYMSPEQARGEKLDHRSDLYSIGVLFYRMLEGKLPFKAETPMGTAMRHITDPVPELSEKHGDMQPFIDRALAKCADDRFQKGQEMINALHGLHKI